MKLLHVRGSAPAALLTFVCGLLTQAHSAPAPAAPAVSQQTAARESDSKQEIAKIYQDWLNQDVVWIITPEEREAFKKLASNAERDAFIGQFWFRRNPEPGSGRNSFKEEHYRRIAYSNAHFADRRPGWKTDRGRIYIVYGKPDWVDSHPQGDLTPLGPKQGGGAIEYPYEVWHYRHRQGVADNVEVEFIDECRCGEYRLVLDPPR